MKPEHSSGMRYAGVDVGARELTAAVYVDDAWRQRTFANTAAGRKLLLRWLAQAGPVHVCLEASGNYGLDLALELSRAEGARVSVVNPRQARRFAETLGERSKTDPVDARVLAEYARRMQPLPGQPPSATALELRATTRLIAQMVRMRTQQHNRLHATSASAALPKLVARELQHQVRHLEQRIGRLRSAARRLVQADAELERRYQQLLTVPGVADITALQLLGELVMLPAELQARQWVAHSGLDPRHYQSGSSVSRPPRISRCGNQRLRAALYMPALVAVQRDPHLGGFYRRLLARGKPPLVALAAVMRKLLHAVHAMLRHDEPYCGSKLCAA